MTSPVELYRRARALGLNVEADGSDLLIKPKSRCTPELVAELREHKSELLDFLQTRTVKLSADCVPWLHVAKQVINGEFSGADGGMIESLFIGLRRIRHPTAREALRKLTTEPACPPGMRKEILHSTE
jgi:TubC N-terminal docking domain